LALRRATPRLGARPVATARPPATGSPVVPRIRHAFIPVGACWLNLQEAWWRIFRQTAITAQCFADPGDIGYAAWIATAQLNTRAEA
jgi:hypothetical protein